MSCYLNRNSQTPLKSQYFQELNLCSKERGQLYIIILSILGSDDICATPLCHNDCEKATNRPCYCDLLCSTAGDCCHDFMDSPCLLGTGELYCPSVSHTTMRLTKTEILSVSIPYAGILKLKIPFIITGCPDDGQGIHCTETEDPLSQIPVCTTGGFYKNMKCALRNREANAKRVNMKFLCNDSISESLRETQASLTIP